MSFDFKIYNDKKLKGVKIIENSFFEDKRGYSIYKF